MIVILEQYPLLSFLVMVLLIALFYVGFYFFSKYNNKQNSTLRFSSFLQKINDYINLNVLFSFFFFVLFLLSLLFKFYFSSVIFGLILLNLYLQKTSIRYLIYFFIFLRLIFFFSPFTDVLAIKVSFESFTFFFCLFGYVFFLLNHKYLILWISMFLRIILGFGMEEGLVLSMYTLKIHIPTPTNTPSHTPTNTPPTTPPITPPISPRAPFFDTIEKHKHAAIIPNKDFLQRKPFLFGDKLIKPWERVYFDPSIISAAEQANFLKHGGSGRMLANFETLTQALGKNNVIKINSDGYEKEMIRIANQYNLPEPARTLVTIDWSLAQENEEFIAIKSYVEAYFPNERIKLSRGYGPIDFILTRQDGSRLFVDVTSLSDYHLTEDREVLDKKLRQLTAIDMVGSKTKVLLYNYHHNSSAFFNAPKLDSRIITVSNTDVQQLLSLHNINVDFLKPVEKSLRLFSFGNTEAAIKYPTLPKEDAIKTIQFTKK